LNKFVIQIKPV